jgi:hypothetical protein
MVTKKKDEETVPMNLKFKGKFVTYNVGYLKPKKK